MNRREFCEWLGGSSVLAATLPPFSAGDAAGLQAASAAAQGTGSDLGTLYPFIQKQADRSTFELSFLHKRFRRLETWQKTARARVLQQLFYTPPAVIPAPVVERRQDRGGYVEEYLTFADDARPASARVRAHPEETRSVRRQAFCPARSWRVLRVGQGEGSCATTSIPCCGVQGAVVRGEEHRDRIGPPGLRRDDDRHVLLGRAALLLDEDPAWLSPRT